MVPKYRLRTEALEWREVEGEIVAVDLRRSVYLAVNPTGAMLWGDLVHGSTRQALIGRLLERCEIDRGRAEHDVGAFLDALREQDLLEQQAL